jgi:hypothetical protein
MTNKELDKLDRLAAAATPGPWERDDRNYVYASGNDFYIVEALNGAKDASLIAAARDAVPALTKAVRERDAEIARLRALVKAAYEEGCFFGEGLDTDETWSEWHENAWEQSGTCKALGEASALSPDETKGDAASSVEPGPERINGLLRRLDAIARRSHDHGLPLDDDMAEPYADTEAMRETVRAWLRGQ